MNGTKGKFIHRVPGHLATGALVLLTTMWVWWGAGEMYYEGWWGSWLNRLPYLAPAVCFLLLTTVCLLRPKVGGWLMVVIGTGVFIWWMVRVNFAVERLFVGLMLGGFALLIGLLFLWEACRQKRFHSDDSNRHRNWFHRQARFILGFTPPLAVFVGVTVFFAPLVMSRVDSGSRGEYSVTENGLRIVWAPAGPGWAKGFGPSQEAGRLLLEANLSWNDLALYGAPPIGFKESSQNATADDMQETGLCRYLSGDGTVLMDEPQDIWRMPTTDEIVRALVRGGENAGCVWDGKSTRADCEQQPNKDSPLWDPDASPIYYWSADEYDEESAWYVPYTGGGAYGGQITYQPKSWGNSRHGFRCVRDL